MQQWEYMILVDATEPDLNKYGEQGWEIVAVSTENVMLATGIRTVRWVYIKRAKRAKERPAS